MGTLGIACDHAGLELKAHLAGWLRERGVTVEDLGTRGPESVDYPDYAVQVAEGIASGRFDLGLLVCGTGIGMSITANRFCQVRAALCTSAYMARMARAHNNANLLCLGARVVEAPEAESILEAFLQTSFEAGRHARRVDKMEAVAERKKE